MSDDSANARHHSASSPSGRVLAAGEQSGISVGAAFPRACRLLDGRSYDTVFGDNRRVADRYWTVLVHNPAQGDAATSARLGLAIAKKRAKRAVDRNRIKRVARESFRHIRSSLGCRQIVVMNRDAASTASTAELRQSLDTLWARLLRQSGTGNGAPDKRGARHRSSARGSRR